MTQKSLFVSGAVIIALVIAVGLYWLNQFPVYGELTFDAEKTFDPRIAFDNSLPDVVRGYWYCKDGSMFQIHFLQGHVVVTLNEKILRSFPFNPSNQTAWEEGVTYKTDLDYSYTPKTIDGVVEMLVTNPEGTTALCSQPLPADN